MLAFAFLFWQITGWLRPNIFSLGGLFVITLFVWTIYKAIRSSKEAKKRAADVNSFGVSNGWTPVPRASISNFPNRRSYSILNRGSEKIRAFLQRAHDGGSVSLFDYTYRERRGKVVHYYTQTIVAFSSSHLNLPYFELATETFGSRLGEIFGYRDIDFITHPEFSRQFHLGGKDEMPIRAVFTPQVLSYLEKLPGLQIDAGGNHMLIYYHARVVPVEHLNDFLGLTLNVYNLFRR